MQIRINKFLSQSGIGSRRNVEQMLWESRFQVNGKTAIPGQMIETEKDVVTHDGKPVKASEGFTYIALNKPMGFVSTTSDEMGRKTIIDIVKTNERLYPIGRLDKNSTGLIILTNDGDTALKLTHPRYHLPKTYVVTITKNASDDQLKKLSTGVTIQVELPKYKNKDGRFVDTETQEVKTAPAEVIRITEKSFKIIVHQGMKRQIREMCKAVGLSVYTLNRISIGDIQLGNLGPGEYRNLTTEEIKLISL